MICSSEKGDRRENPWSAWLIASQHMIWCLRCSSPQKFSRPLHDLHSTAPHRTAPVFLASTQPPQLLFLLNTEIAEKTRRTEKRRKRMGSWFCGSGRANRLFMARCNLPWQVIQNARFIHRTKPYAYCYFLLIGTNTSSLTPANLVELHFTPYWLASVIRPRTSPYFLVGRM